jgi:type I restriction enzyme M protein
MARSRSKVSTQSTATIGRTVANGRQSPQQHGRGRIQARRAGPHLPQVHLRHFEEHRAKLLAGEGDYDGANAEDPDEYKTANVFCVPADARWSYVQSNAKQPTIGKRVDDAMVALERDNPRLEGALPKDYARSGLDKHRLVELIDVIATIELTAASEGEKTHRSVDLLCRVYEYFLTRFASAEGKNGGQFYTPSCVVRCLVEMLAPNKGRVYDPACGSGGMFVQSEKFVESHGGKIGDIALYGQESNATTRRLAIMSLAIRGLSGEPFINPIDELERSRVAR